MVKGNRPGRSLAERAGARYASVVSLSAQCACGALNNWFDLYYEKNRFTEMHGPHPGILAMGKRAFGPSKDATPAVRQLTAAFFSGKAGFELPSTAAGMCNSCRAGRFRFTGTSPGGVGFFNPLGPAPCDGPASGPFVLPKGPDSTPASKVRMPKASVGLCPGWGASCTMVLHRSGVPGIRAFDP